MFYHRSRSDETHDQTQPRALATEVRGPGSSVARTWPPEKAFSGWSRSHPVLSLLPQCTQKVPPVQRNMGGAPLWTPTPHFLLEVLQDSNNSNESEAKSQEKSGQMWCGESQCCCIVSFPHCQSPSSLLSLSLVTLLSQPAFICPLPLHFLCPFCLHPIVQHLFYIWYYADSFTNMNSI